MPKILTNACSYIFNIARHAKTRKISICVSAAGIVSTNVNVKAILGIKNKIITDPVAMTRVLNGVTPPALKQIPI